MNNEESRVFLHEDGYVVMVFYDLIDAAELRRLLSEINHLAEIHGPTGVLLDGRNGRLNRDASTIIVLAETKFSSQITHMVVLTANSTANNNVIVKKPPGLVPQITAEALGVPLVYLANEDEARRWAASGKQ